MNGYRGLTSDKFAPFNEVFSRKARQALDMDSLGLNNTLLYRTNDLGRYSKGKITSFLLL